MSRSTISSFAQRQPDATIAGRHRPVASRAAWRPDTRICATAIVLLAGVLAACFPPAERNENFRLRKMLKAGWRIARGEDVSRVLTQKYAGYDVGTPLFLAVTMKLTLSDDQLAEGPPTQAPPLFHWAHRAGFIVAITALFAALWGLTTPFVAAGVATLLLASPNWRFIAWSDDVYLFPLYAFAATCVAIAVINQRSRIAWPALIVCAMAIGAACTFRNVSLLCVCPLLLLVVRPTTLQTTAAPRSTRIRAAATFLIATICAVLPGRLVSSPGHVFWHPMHCGLAEFGGHEDAQARLYPWFINENELPEDAVPVQDWTDERSYRRARALVPDIVVCSPEYDAIMREDYLALWKAYPVAMAQTYARRLMNVLTLNPWQSHTADSRIIHSLADTMAVAFFPAILLIAWRIRIPRRAFWLTIAFAPMIIAPMIAHSGYIMYNAPAQLPAYVLAFWTLHHAIRRVRPRWSVQTR